MGLGGKNSPIQYIPEKDPVQEALKKNKKTNYFKLTLPHTLDGNVGNISATFRPDTPRSHNLGDIWNVTEKVTGCVGPYFHALCHF